MRKKNWWGGDWGPPALIAMRGYDAIQVGASYPYTLQNILSYLRSYWDIPFYTLLGRRLASPGKNDTRILKSIAYNMPSLGNL